MIDPDKSNGEKRLGSWIYRSVHMLINVAALVVMGYIGMWLKTNVPSKMDFRDFKGEVQEDVKKLQIQVNGLDRSIILLAETNKRIDDFEARIRKLEQGESRRPPPPRP